MEYRPFRKGLKALKSPSGDLEIVDGTAFFEFFDMNSIDRDSSFFVLMSKSHRNLKFNESWMCCLHHLHDFFDKDSCVDE